MSMNVSAKFFLVPVLLLLPVGGGSVLSVHFLCAGVSFIAGFGSLVLIAPLGCPLLVWWVSGGVIGVFNGEFDPGSGRTLAACLTHASRTVRPFGVHEWRTGE